MMINIVSIGRFRFASERALFCEYQKIIKNLELEELPYSPELTPAARRLQEAKSISNFANLSDSFIALDVSGEVISSSESIKKTKNYLVPDMQTTFIIGGPDGLDESIINRASLVLSLGRISWPHSLCRILLVEQLKRYI